MRLNLLFWQFSGNFTILLFHYDGRTTEWDEFEWSKRAIHVSVHQQTKWYVTAARFYVLFMWQVLILLLPSRLRWFLQIMLVIFTFWNFVQRWYAKRFLHPDIVAPYDYIFIWDEDLGVENFNAEEWVWIWNLCFMMTFFQSTWTIFYALFNSISDT